MATEARRLQALDALGLMDTQPHPAFDCVTAAASLSLRAPIALISLIGAERQWFKSVVGLDRADTPRAIAFCAHTIEGWDPVVVADARNDARFRDNPLVAGEPFVRAYAGVPLIDPEGFALGTLCVLDTRPRDFTAADLLILSHLADAALTAIASHRQGLIVKKAERVMKTLSFTQLG